MGLTRERKIFFSILGIAGLVLVIDQGFLQPKSASAAEASSDTGGGFSSVVSGIGDVVEEQASGVKSAVTDLGMSNRIERVRSQVKPTAGVGDAFALPRTGAVERVTDGLDTTAEQVSSEPEIVLSAVMPSRRSGGVAIINGQPVKAGQGVGQSGWVLKAVGRDHVVIGRGADSRTLKMPG